MDKLDQRRIDARIVPPKPKAKQAGEDEEEKQTREKRSQAREMASIGDMQSISGVD